MVEIELNCVFILCRRNLISLTKRFGGTAIRTPAGPGVCPRIPPASPKSGTSQNGDLGVKWDANLPKVDKERQRNQEQSDEGHGDTTIQ